MPNPDQAKTSVRLMAERIAHVLSVVGNPYHQERSDPSLAGYLKLADDTQRRLTRTGTHDFQASEQEVRGVVIEAVLSGSGFGMEIAAARLEMLADEAVAYAASFRGQDGAGQVVDEQMARAKAYRDSAEVLRKPPVHPVGM